MKWISCFGIQGLMPPPELSYVRNTKYKHGLLPTWRGYKRELLILKTK